MSKMVKTGSKYTDEDRRGAVVLFASKGLMSNVSRNTGIPESTLCEWKKSGWWDDVLAEVRSEINEQILAQNLEIATKAGELVLDSIENGDEKLVWDKNKGEHVIKRVKPSGKDAAVISGITQDKARVQLNLPTSITDNVSSREHIKELAAYFAEISRAAYEEKKINSIPGESQEVG